MKWQRFTDRSRFAIVQGRKEAKRLLCPYASTEHLLLGLIWVEGVGLEVLLNSNVSIERVVADVESKHRDNTATPENLDHTVEETTPAMLQVLQLAAQESCLMNLDYIGTEHLLLALLHVEDGLAAQALLRQDLTLDKARLYVQNRPSSKKAGDDDEATKS